MSDVEVTNSKKTMGERLYEMTPVSYKQFDSEQKPMEYPLKRFMKLFDKGGWEDVQQEIEDLKNMYDPLRTPERNLDLLAEILGFRFPITTVDDGQGGKISIFLTPEEKRQFLALLPTLYKYKGTPRLFYFLGRNIFGADTTVVPEWIPRTQSSTGKHTINLNVSVEDGVLNLGAKSERYRMFAEKFRPVNNILNVTLKIIYSDDYLATKDDTLFDTYRDFLNDTYASASISESSIESLSEVQTETYNSGSISETDTNSLFDFQTETYDSSATLDSAVDVIQNLGTRLTRNYSGNRITRGFRLTKPYSEVTRPTY